MDENEITPTEAAIREDIRALFADYPRILTIEQAAAALQVTERVIAAANRRGEIRAVKMGRSWHFPQAALIEWVAAKASVPRAAADEDDLTPPPRHTWAEGRSAQANARIREQ